MEALFVLAVVIWLISGVFCGEVAEQKGYSRANWVFAGFLFGFIALIAVAGLPDRKLRKYLLQIGVKQDAIKRATLDDEEDKAFSGNQKIRFITEESDREEETYKKLLSCITDNETKERFIRKVEYTVLEKLPQSANFYCQDKEKNYLLMLSGRKVEGNQIEWIGTL